MAAKPRAYRGDEHTWRPAEWAEPIDEAQEVVVEDYALTVFRVTEEVDGVRQPTKQWAWQVKATSEISETPEVFGAGDAASLGGAQWNATHSLNKALRMRYREQRKAEAERKPEPTASEMLEAVEKKVAADKKPAPKARQRRQKKTPVAA